jgi:hypothetical protein
MGAILEAQKQEPEKIEVPFLKRILLLATLMFGIPGAVLVTALYYYNQNPQINIEVMLGQLSAALITLPSIFVFAPMIFPKFFKHIKSVLRFHCLYAIWCVFWGFFFGMFVASGVIAIIF